MATNQDELNNRAEHAARQGDATALEKCFSRGLPISVVNQDLDSPILISAMDSGSRAEEIFKVLLNNGWNINQKLEMIGTAVNHASFAGDVSLVKFLLSKGADPNRGGGPYGKGTIIWPIIDEKLDSLDMLRTLLSESLVKIDIGASGAVLAAVEKGSLAALKLVLEYDRSAVDSIAKWKHGSKGNGEIRTPLYAAVTSGDTEKAKYLLSQGADPTWKDSQNRTVANVAQAQGGAEMQGLFRQ